MEGLNIRSLHYTIKTCTLNTAFGIPKFWKIPMWACRCPPSMYLAIFRITFFEWPSPTDILPDTYFDLLSGIVSGIIPFGVLFGILSRILSDISSDSLSGILCDILQQQLRPAELWHSPLRSGNAHWHLAVAVEVWQCQLRSGARGWGPALPTEL